MTISRFNSAYRQPPARAGEPVKASDHPVMQALEAWSRLAAPVSNMREATQRMTNCWLMDKPELDLRNLDIPAPPDLKAFNKLKVVKLTPFQYANWARALSLPANCLVDYGLGAQPVMPLRQGGIGNAVAAAPPPARQATAASVALRRRLQAASTWTGSPAAPASSTVSASSLRSASPLIDRPPAHRVAFAPVASHPVPHTPSLLFGNQRPPGMPLAQVDTSQVDTRRSSGMQRSQGVGQNFAARPFAEVVDSLSSRPQLAGGVDSSSSRRPFNVNSTAPGAT
ncbi:MAG: hypothetical protein ACRYGK_14075, partial [Janthinobacterium lividum]